MLVEFTEQVATIYSFSFRVFEIIINMHLPVQPSVILIILRIKAYTAYIYRLCLVIFTEVKTKPDIFALVSTAVHDPVFIRGSQN